MKKQVQIHTYFFDSFFAGKWLEF